jgi:hypothetical protein
MSLNAIATPAALEPGPLVTLVLSLTVAKVDSVVISSFQVDHGCDLVGCVVDGVVDASAGRCGAGFSRGLIVIEERRAAAAWRGVGA